MNHRQAELFRQLLIEACGHYQEVDGGKIIAGTWDKEGGQCPITCLTGIHHTPGQIVDEINSLLGTTTFSWEEVMAFVYTFDDNAYYARKQYVSAMLIARELRDKYIHA